MVSTKEVYQSLKRQMNWSSHPDIDGMIEALKQGSLQGITDRMDNVLETVTVEQFPVIAQIKGLHERTWSDECVNERKQIPLYLVYIKREQEAIGRRGRQIERDGTGQADQSNTVLQWGKVGQYMSDAFQVKWNGRVFTVKDVVLIPSDRRFLRVKWKPGETDGDSSGKISLESAGTPIREAIRKLELEGLVVMIQDEVQRLHRSHGRISSGCTGGKKGTGRSGS